VIGPGLAIFDERREDGLAATAGALSRPGIDPWARGMLHLLRGAFLENEGEPAGELRELEAAAAGFREVGDRWGLSMVLTSLGELHERRGELDRAIAALEEARRLMGELRADPDVGRLRIKLAAIRARWDSDPEAARAELLEMAADAEREGSTFMTVLTHLALGDLYRWEGERAEAARRYAVAASRVDSRTFAQPQLTALVRASASMVEPVPETAAGLLRQALDGALGAADMPVAAAVGVAVATFRAERGDPADAAVALGAAAALRGMPGTGPDVERLTARLRTRLGEAGYAAAYGRGNGLPRRSAFAELGRGLRLAPVGADGQREEDREDPR
jgi:tetratricopeptide (TPR) repeat protein